MRRTREGSPGGCPLSFAVGAGRYFGRCRAVVLVGLAVAAIGAGAGQAAERVVPRTTAEMQLSFAPVVRQVAPAVANIYAKRLVRTERRHMLFDDPFFRRFFGDDLFSLPGRSKVQNSLGSGVIVRPYGLIVTNNHVIEGATEITVVLSDRREFDAEIVLTDDKSDLAVLRIETEGEALPYLDFRDSDQLQVGDIVLAIGNPFGVGQTVTSGIISALARTAVARGGAQAFIQTDAAINPGNSGGALVSVDGLLVGINTAIFSRSGGSLGIGFAIPANLVAVVVASAETGNRVVRPWFGANGQLVDAELAASLGLDRPGGVLINQVYPGSPADRAGLAIGDVLLSINGREVVDVEGLKFRIATLAIGDRAKLLVWRQGRLVKLTLRLEPAPEDPPRDTAKLAGRHPFGGMTVANLSPLLADELGIDPLGHGVIVLDVAAGSPSYRLRFKAGDILVRLNRVEIESVAQLRRLLKRYREEWNTAIRRDGRLLNMVIR